MFWVPDMTRDTAEVRHPVRPGWSFWTRLAIVCRRPLPTTAGADCIFGLSADAMPVATILLAAVVAIVVCAWRNVRLPATDIVTTAALVACLTAGACYYRARREQAFVLCFTTLAQVVAFAACYIVLMYALATLTGPLVDAELASFDDWCGLTATSVRHWSNAHPAIAKVLNVAYDTLLLQTALAVAVLGLGNDRRRLTAFVAAFMIAALMALGLFVVFPAEGPFARFGFNPLPDQATFLEHFHSLRDGSRSIVSLRASEGLITFPSFHVTWAILLTWAFRGRRVLFAAGVVLNSLIVLSTMTTGWHYFADVLGGAAIALAAICSTFARRNNHKDTETQREERMVGRRTIMIPSSLTPNP
jgi:membrane-associated phospholipid phosphatase